MHKKQPEVSRLVADIPVELKRKIAAAATLRNNSIKDVIIEMTELWFTNLNPEEQELIDQILERQRGMLSKAA